MEASLSVVVSYCRSQSVHTVERRDFRFISGVPFSSMAMSMTLAPRIQIYTELACDQYKPEYSNDTVGVVANTISAFSEFPTSWAGRPPSLTLRAAADRPYELCVADPDVQQAVSRLALTMLTAMGILGCLTTGFWGSVRRTRHSCVSFACSLAHVLPADRVDF